MKLKIMVSALEAARNSGLLSLDEVTEVGKYIHELRTLYDGLQDINDPTEGSDMFVLDYLQALHIMQVATYDLYGRAARRNNNTLSFVQYCVEAACIDDTLPSEMYADAFDMVQNLWADNEEDGYNNADGTFKHDAV